VAIQAKRQEWAVLIRRNTKVAGVTTESADEKLGHFQCSTKLTYVDDQQTLESLDINFEVKPVEGGERPFELSWETVPTVLGDADPIANLSARITHAWLQKEKTEWGQMYSAKQKEIEERAKQEAIEFAKANPPIPRTREELSQEASNADLNGTQMRDPALVEDTWAEMVFGDLNGDGHDDLAAIRAYKERDLQRGGSATVTTYNMWVFEQYPVKYGEKFAVSPVSYGSIGSSINSDDPPYSNIAVTNGKVAVTLPDGEVRELDINKKVEPLPAFDNDQYMSMVSARLEALRAELSKADQK